MKKSLVALAVAAISTAAFSQTDVTIYGTADVSVQGTNISQGVARGGPQGGTTAVQSNGSLLGFKGNEDLGNGNAALFQIETQVNLTGVNGNQASATTQGNAFSYMRDSFVGYASNYGTGKGGYFSTPYRATLLSYDVFPGDSSDATILNLFGRTYTGAGGNQSAGVGGYAANQTAAFRGTTVAYSLPAFSGVLTGVTGSIAYSGNGSNNNNGNQINGQISGNEYTAMIAPNSVFGGSLGWARFGFGVDGSIQQASYNNQSGSNVQPLGSSTNYLLGANYTGLPGLKTGVVYGRNSLGVNSSGTTGSAKGASNSVWVGASYRFGNNEPRASYAVNSNTSGLAQASTFGSQNGGNQWNLGWGYYLSKRTQVYGLVSGIHNNANGVYNFYNATGTGTNALTGGQVLTTYGAGLRTNF